MIIVTRTQLGKRFRIVPNDHGVHALGNGNLPGIVFAHALIGAALAQGRPFPVLTPNGLPSKSTKRLAHCLGIIRVFQNLHVGNERNPKISPGVAPKPSVSRSGFAAGHLIMIVDDK